MENKVTDSERLARIMGDELGTLVARRISEWKQSGTSYKGGYRKFITESLRRVRDSLDSVGLRHDQDAYRSALLAYYDAALPAVDDGGEVQP
jgi:hypothetical protein